MTYTRIATDNNENPHHPPPSGNNAYPSSSYQSFRGGPSSSSSSSRQQHHHYNHQHQQAAYHKSDLDRRVDDSIEIFLRTLTPIGPELMAGNLAISFFERRSKNKLFGLVNQEEKVVWEQWILRVVVNNTPRPMGEDEASVIERQRIQVRPRPSASCHNVFQQWMQSSKWKKIVVSIFYTFAFEWLNHVFPLNCQDTAEGMLKAVLLKVFELAGSETDHIPPVMVSMLALFFL